MSGAFFLPSLAGGDSGYQRNTGRRGDARQKRSPGEFGRDQVLDRRLHGGMNSSQKVGSGRDSSEPVQLLVLILICGSRTR